MEAEQEVMMLIMYGGDARSYSLRAIQAAENGAFDKAQTLMAQADESMAKAHEAQTKLIQDEVQGNDKTVSLLMVHAQDHVMNAMTMKELAVYLIRNQQEIHELRERLQ